MDVLPVYHQPVSSTIRQDSGRELVSAPTAPAVSRTAIAVADSAGTAAAKEAPTSNQVAQAVKQVNEAFAVKGLNLYASFEKDKISGVDIVKILEKKSNEVIRQLPPQEMVAFAQTLVLPEGWRGQWIRNMT